MRKNYNIKQNRRKSYKTRKKSVKINFIREISLGDILNILALILTACSLCISIKSFSYTERKDLYNEQERINIQFKGIDKNYDTRYIELQNNSDKYMIPIKYDIIISNNSNKKITMNNCSLWEITSEDEKIYYSNLVRNLYFNNDKNINLPLSIDAGDFIIMNIELNYFINKEVNNILKEKYNKNSEITFKELEEYLIHKNLDIYGNKYKEIKNEYGHVYGYKSIKSVVFPRYDIEIKTSTGQIFAQYIDILNRLNN